MAAALFLSASCNDPPAIRRAEQTPARQFILQSVRFEERRDGHVLWTGTGSHADGDLQVSDMADVVLHRVPQTAQETPFVLRSPRGHLAFDAGRATFDTVQVSDPSGGVLTATHAVYDENSGSLEAAGPIHVTTPSLVAQASRATVWLKTGTVEVHGPVEGRLHSLQGSRDAGNL